MKKQEITLIKKYIAKEYRINNNIIILTEDKFIKYKYTLQNELLIILLKQISNNNYTSTILSLEHYVDRLYMLKIDIEHIIEKRFIERDYKELIEYNEYAKAYRSVINAIEYNINEQ